MQYLAYGSNMCLGRLRGRVPSATYVGVAMVRGRSFRFHKRSIDGSGKADAFETGNPSDIVWGVIFDIKEKEKPSLDQAEGLGNGYLEIPMTAVDDSAQEHRVFLYVADANSIDETLRPYSWYKRFVIGGARQHDLPDAYISAIAAMPEIADQNRTRDQGNRSITC
jgi:AIG2-like family